MFDLENARNAELIEEREFYESEFLNDEDILKSYELSRQISYTFNEEFQTPQEEYFLFEDYMVKRDEKLIEEREIYETEYFSEDFFQKEDTLDLIISDMDKEELFIENDYYEDDYLLDFDEMEVNYEYADLQMAESYCDPYDKLDGYDYPEGPAENLNGILFY